MDVKTKTERQTKEMVKETVFKERAQKVLASMKENGMDQLSNGKTHEPGREFDGSCI